jgi:hypothetical protein
MSFGANTSFTNSVISEIGFLFAAKKPGFLPRILNKRNQSMKTLAPLTESEVKQLVDDWYSKLDIHAPVEEFLPMLADKNLEMQFPEGTLHSLDEFKTWYDRVTYTFFDEVHTMQVLNITPALDQANIQLVVRWEAHRWHPPAPKSERLDFDAAQRWVVKRSPDTQKPVIVTYIVDSLTPQKGSASL